MVTSRAKYAPLETLGRTIARAKNGAAGCYDNHHRQAVKQIDQVAAILQAPIGQRTVPTGL